MLIREVSVENFKGFERSQLLLDPNFTLLVGNNASGKSSWLDAVSVGIGGFLSGFKGVSDVTARHIRPDEIRRQVFIRHGMAFTELQYPAKVSVTADIEGIEFSWAREVRGDGGRTTQAKPKDILGYVQGLKEDVRHGVDRALPVFSYYGTGRLWNQRNDSSEILNPSRFIGYADCLSPASNEKYMEKWFRRMALISAQEGRDPAQYVAVGLSMIRFLSNLGAESNPSNVSMMGYNLNTDEMEIVFEDGARMPYRLLSDGYRNMLGMVSDIAYRAAVLNPHLGENAALLSPGVVLIDEIDLHLHPRWQRHVVEDLKRTFRNMQFIATTHSPFIVQSMEQGEVRSLGIQITGDYEDKSIEDIAENVMGVELPQVSERRSKMEEAAAEYFSLLRDYPDADPQRVQALKDRMDELMDPFRDDPAFTAFLRQKRHIAEVQRMEGPDASGR